MKTYTKEELANILDLHAKWLNDIDDGLRADLRFADLRSADLSFADLRFANLDKRYIQISCIGSRKGLTTYCFDDDEILCGCFKGNLSEFEKQVNITHQNHQQYLNEYMGFINYIRGLQKWTS